VSNNLITFKQKMMQQINTALCSFGLSGLVFHAPFLIVNPGFKVTKVLERSKENSRAKLPEAQIVRSYDEILSDENVDLVIVNTPNELHFEMAKQALLHNKHVLIEKPFTTEVEEANELIKLAKERNLVLTAYHNRRLDSDFRTIRKIIKENVLGELKVFDSQIFRWKPEVGNKAWKTDNRAGAGLLYDLGSHLIDQALVLFAMPKAVFADIRTLRAKAIADDYFELILYYDVLKVNLKSSLFSNIPGHRFVIQGEKGNCTKFGDDVQESLLMKGDLPSGKNWGKEDGNQWASITLENENYSYPSLPGNYMIFFDNLYEAITEKTELLVKAEEAKNVIKIIKLAQQSHKERRIIDVI
jgi:scyllo-inositol 2-dehydrogenase (NADP+)